MNKESKFALYIDASGILHLDLYEHSYSENKKRSIKGEEAYQYLKNISDESIKHIVESKNEKHVVLRYKDFSLLVVDYENLFSKGDFSILLKSIMKYYEHQNVRKVKKKKVVRKNKHSNQKIVVMGLSLALVSSIFTTGIFMGKEPAQKVEIPESSFVLEKNDSKLVPEKNDFSEVMKEEPTIEEVSLEEVKPVFIDYQVREENDFSRVQELYGESLMKYSAMYGLDYNLMSAIATQERGIHSETVDSGGAIGLMQIQVSVWSGEQLTAYNFETGENETIFVDPERLSELDYNIKVGCMIFQWGSNQLDHNILASIQAYNMGIGSVFNILNAYASDTGQTIDNILQNQENSEWLGYRDMIRYGDTSYIEHVFSRIGPNVEIQNRKKDGNVVNLSITNQENEKARVFN